jgi:S1-C subfamily serine protease
MRRLIILIIILVLALGAVSAAEKYIPAVRQAFDNNSSSLNLPEDSKNVKVVTEESITIDIVKKAGPSVVTVSGQSKVQSRAPQNSPYDFGPFQFFGFGAPGQQQQPQQDQGGESIGSGFVITSDGMIVTNKHVVSDTNMSYQVVTSDGKKYNVKNVYRDPLNDVALIKIDPNDNPGKHLIPLTLGDSSRLQAGQYVIAIGTALGDLQNTVTTGVISGLARGITAGSPYEGSVEQLDNVIQTDAAINPGNSGGPLINSSGQVIGVNTAVSESGQNIGFAIPINVIKDSLANFNSTGQFNRPFLGVSYTMISRDLALLNNLPEGAYVQDVSQDSPADKAGIQQGDVIVKIDGQRIDNKTQLSAVIGKKKVGDTITITIYRDNQTQDVKATLEAAPQQ